MSSTHIRFDDGYQEWQLVDNETHEILRVADNIKELCQEGLEFLEEEAIE